MNTNSCTVDLHTDMYRLAIAEWKTVVARNLDRCDESEAILQQRFEAHGRRVGRVEEVVQRVARRPRQRVCNTR